MTGIIVRTKIKEIVQEVDGEGVVNNISEEVGPAIDEKVKQIIKEAVKRAKANQRKTLFARDL